MSDDREMTLREFIDSKLSIHHLASKQLAVYEKQVNELMNEQSLSKILQCTIDEQDKDIEILRAAVIYTTQYLDESKYNNIGSGSKAHKELMSALKGGGKKPDFKKGDYIRAIKGPMCGSNGCIALTDGKEALLDCTGRNAGLVVSLKHCVRR